MKIYFCGSIRGGRQDGFLYERIVRQLKQYGTVLTEVVGDPTMPEEDRVPDGKDKSCHDRNMRWFKDADVVVAEVTQPSLGVGYELGRAVEMKKRTLCLFRPEEGRKLSAMIRGAEDLDFFKVVDYTEAELADILDGFLSRYKTVIGTSV